MKLGRLPELGPVAEFNTMLAVRERLRPEKVRLPPRSGQGVRSEVGLSYDDLRGSEGVRPQTVAGFVKGQWAYPPVDLLHRFAVAVSYDLPQEERLLWLASLICLDAVHRRDRGWRPGASSA